MPEINISNQHYFVWNYIVIKKKQFFNENFDFKKLFIYV